MKGSAGMRWVLAGAALLGLAGAAGAQTLDALKAAETATYEAWEKMPLTARKALFVTASSGFGMYEERASNIFKAGEPIITYVEPVGFGWKPLEGERYEIGFDIDLQLKIADGTVVSDKKGFMKTRQQTHAQNKEYSLDLTLTLNDAPPGKYSVVYTLHDTSTGESSTVNQAFEIQQ